MTPSEFKAWFEGFTEAFDSKIPSKTQWTRIKERVGEIDGKPITERVFVDRWYPYWHTFYATISPTVGVPYYGALGGNTSGIAQGALGQFTLTNSNLNTLNDGHSVTCDTFDSCVAMNAVGRAEAASLSG
jgi:hypothetical protein